VVSRPLSSDKALGRLLCCERAFAASTEQVLQGVI